MRTLGQRCTGELARIGGRPGYDELTTTEREVAARAAYGQTNREIARALFMSVKTVEANLSRVYRKLDVSSRRELGPELASGEGVVEKTPRANNSGTSVR